MTDENQIMTEGTDERLNILCVRMMSQRQGKKQNNYFLPNWKALD